MSATPASVERVQKYVFNFEIYRFVKKRPIYPILPYFSIGLPKKLVRFSCKFVLDSLFSPTSAEPHGSTYGCFLEMP